MSTPFIAEVKIFSFGFPPKGWASCDGRLLPINQNQALFSILGTTYGGNGQTTFGLPNLQGKVPLHTGNNFQLGEVGGEPAHTLTTQEMPQHSHAPGASSLPATLGDPSSNFWAAGPLCYTADPPNNAMNAGLIGLSGNNQPHANQSPFLVLNLCIALQGIFPSRN